MRKTRGVQAPEVRRRDVHGTERDFVSRFPVNMVGEVLTFNFFVTVRAADSYTAQDVV